MEPPAAHAASGGSARPLDVDGVEAYLTTRPDLLLGPEIGLEDLPTVLAATQVGRPPKYVVYPGRA